MIDPWRITDEDIEELINATKVATNEGMSNEYDFGWSDGFLDVQREFVPPVIECKHEYKAVLLLDKTVYDCKFCGKHKESK